MFTLKRPLARNVSAELDDTANVKFALTALGYYDDSETGLSPYGDDGLFKSVQAFQKDNDLKVDGVINPDGETQRTMKDQLKKKPQAGSAFGDFWKNYWDMRKTDFKGGDKYFHCKANYEATKRGWDGDHAAQFVSRTKELFWAPREIYRDGPSAAWQDIKDDSKANKHGRDAARSGNFKSARDACKDYRPDGLDEKY